MSSGPLPTIPNEVWLMILELLDPDSLVSAMAVHRLWNELIAENRPRMLRHIIDDLEIAVDDEDEVTIRIHDTNVTYSEREYESMEAVRLFSPCELQFNIKDLNRLKEIVGMIPDYWLSTVQKLRFMDGSSVDFSGLLHRMPSLDSLTFDALAQPTPDHFTSIVDAMASVEFIEDNRESFHSEKVAVVDDSTLELLIQKSKTTCPLQTFWIEEGFSEFSLNQLIKFIKETRFSTDIDEFELTVGKINGSRKNFRKWLKKNTKAMPDDRVVNEIMNVVNPTFKNYRFEYKNTKFVVGIEAFTAA